MTDRWIVGDFTTGRLVTEITSPGPGSSWEASLTGGGAELELIPSARLHKTVGELLRDKLGYRYYIAAINEQNMIEFAGPVTGCQLDSGSWRFSASSAWEYLDRRTLIPDGAPGSNWFDIPAPVVQTFRGTWRQIIAAIWNLELNRGYIGKPADEWRASTELRVAWKDFFGSEREVAKGGQYWADPPIIPVGSQTEGGGTHEWSIDCYDLDTIGEVLDQINRRESGVEIQLQPVWLGEFPNGVICWQVVTGIDTSPHVIPSVDPWPLDVGAQASRVQVLEWRADGEKILTTARVLAGRSAASADAKPFIGWANQRELGNGEIIGPEYPEMDVADTQHTSITRLATANDRARAMCMDGTAPATSCEVTVQPGGALNPDLIRVGDLASLYGSPKHAFLPDGVQRMRVLRKSRRGQATKMSLVGLRAPDLARYATRWGNQGE